MGYHKRLLSEHLRGILMLDLIQALYHSDKIQDKEMFIADFFEILDEYVVSKDDTNN